MTRHKATAVGFIAVLLWSSLALLAVWSVPVPPLQLNAVCFGIGGLIGIVWTAGTGGLTKLKQVRWTVYAFGTVGLFGYHYLYFSALRAAPAPQAGLIAYLWPLLIVVLSGLLPGEKLRAGHIIGALISFAGAAMVILSSKSGFDPDHMLGYGLAACCAVVWAGYSVLSRRLGTVPTQAVAVFCLATALLSGVAHMMLETTAWPGEPIGWIALVLLGIGPVGFAFYVWDIGVKQGDIQLLGVASYGAPLLSTIILIIAGIAEPTWALLLAAGLIVGGALLAARTSRVDPTNS